MINNDERIEEKLFLNNDALDDDNIENGDVSSRVALQILRLQVHFCFKMIKKSMKVFGLWMSNKGKFLITFSNEQKKKAKQKSSVKPKAVKPFDLFISGSDGAGKSHSIKPIYKSVAKLLQYHGGSPEKPRVLVLALFGVASLMLMALQYIQH